jgi:hypothetical protein
MSRISRETGLTAARYADEFVRLPQPGHRSRYAPIRLIPVQQEFLRGFDAVDPATQLPVYPECGFFSIKKTGKDTVCSICANSSLYGDPFEHEPREILIVSGSLDQSVSVSFDKCKQFARSHPWTAKHTKEYQTELIYTEHIVDERTGGRTRIDHILRALAAGRPETLHGRHPNLTIFTEAWTATYRHLEALAPPPTRRAPRLLYASYAGLKAQAKPGQVLWDLWQRWKAADPALFVAYLGGPDAWRQVPWMTEKFIATERRRLEHVPSRYRRLWQNEWPTSDDDATGFLTPSEIADAVDHTLVEPDGPIAGDVALGLDIGVAKDTTVACVSNIGSDGKLTVQAVRVWRPTSTHRVSLTALEEELVVLARTLGVKIIVSDSWQALLLMERLRARLPHVEVRTVVSDPANLDRWATMLKSWFRDRTIRIPNHAPLLEQLDALRAEELRRRDRVRFTASGEGHDDAAVALCLSAEGLPQRDIGLAKLPASFRCCWRAANILFDPSSCFVIGGSGATFIPPANDAVCRECIGLIAVKDSYVRHVDSGGERLPLREFRRRFVMGNEFTSRVAQSKWEHWYV